MAKPNKRPGIIAVAVIVSIVLYLAGVFSGLYANKIVEREVQEDITFLKSYMDSSALDLKNIQLQQLFLDQFEAQNGCEFSEIYLNKLHSQLSTFWDVLPSRLEAYERNNEPSEQYITLKREYTRLSLRVWLTAKNAFEECTDSKFIPILYFYSGDCKSCVRQGFEFDAFKKEMMKEGKEVIVFPIDPYFEDDTVFLLKQFYNITSVPAFIIHDQFIQNRVLHQDDLVELIS